MTHEARGWARERVERVHSWIHTHTHRHCLYIDNEEKKEMKMEAGAAQGVKRKKKRHPGTSSLREPV